MMAEVKTICTREMGNYLSDWKMSPGVSVNNGFLFLTAIEVAGFVTPGTVCELRIVAREEKA